MTNRERERMTLDFQKPDRGSIEETFYPWVLTTQRYKQEGIPAEIADGAKDITNDIVGKHENDNPEKYLPVSWGEGVMEYEQYLGFDPVRRAHFVLPFRRFEEKIIEETDEHIIKQDVFGRQNIRKLPNGIEIPYKPIISTEDDWKRMKEHGDICLLYTSRCV